ncbi:epoxide hydrolase family protein [Nocardioides kongjuensis]|uniref:Pimeloyl-ACP methyl ester carboxylesterase n=1 Tax=Nocardioides kongjuensis TaxID=349522 RepID=A0A852S560_9ACTN|nr:epoxide hydrolase [Nocardioides kongjuensis]NYD33892.1 pimeloyl-ACP methyl ester carboxylesterase [Nocardioides kongjuensis]
MNQITPFVIDIAQTDLDDLRGRLDRTRFAPAVPGDSWDYGTPESYLRSMVEQWKAFDWRAVEARLNANDGFVTEVDGQRIHFLHVRSKHADATPLLLAHTYPGSQLDFLDMIDPLVDPEAHGGSADQAFHLVIPSMPGFGFSTPVVETGWTMKRVAAAYDVLMRRLGYDSYGVHGSDGGAMVARELAVADPEGFLGAHVLHLFSFPSGDPAEFEGFGPKEYAALEHLQWFQSVGGYNQMNATRPQTVAAGLADSPVAVLAYSELFESFGNGTSLVAPEQVLAQATLYWLTNTYGAAARYHYEEQHAGAEPVVSTGRIGVAVFKDDFQTIRSLAERDNANIAHWSEFPRGGHFAAMEVPQDVVGDLRVFFA